MILGAGVIALAGLWDTPVIRQTEVGDPGTKPSFMGLRPTNFCPIIVKDVCCENQGTESKPEICRGRVATRSWSYPSFEDLHLAALLLEEILDKAIIPDAR